MAAGAGLEQHDVSVTYLQVSDEKRALRKAQYERFMAKHFPHS